MEFKGGCLCGRVRFKAVGEPYHQTLCHCRTCQMASGAPYVAWVSFKTEEVTITGDPKWRASSAEAERGFCPDCGGSLFFRPKTLEEIDIAAACFDDPEHPKLQAIDSIWMDSAVSWAKEDRLPTFAKRH